MNRSSTFRKPKVSEPQHASCFPPDCYLIVREHGAIEVSPCLSSLLKSAREGYEWIPKGDRVGSQKAIQDLEANVVGYLEDLTSCRTKEMVISICEWGGNRADAINKIKTADKPEQSKMKSAIRELLDARSQSDVCRGLDNLYHIPGIGLVMASKIYRFLRPLQGAALDRHSSYFFNSLDQKEQDGSIMQATDLKREWSAGKHDKSRLAIYYPNGLKHNLKEYVYVYLPMLKKIAETLNESGERFECAATNE